jgi:hypothetical protein
VFESLRIKFRIEVLRELSCNMALVGGGHGCHYGWDSHSYVD